MRYYSEPKIAVGADRNAFSKNVADIEVGDHTSRRNASDASGSVFHEPNVAITICCNPMSGLANAKLGYHPTCRNPTDAVRADAYLCKPKTAIGTGRDPGRGCADGDVELGDHAGRGNSANPASTGFSEPKIAVGARCDAKRLCSNRDAGTELGDHAACSNSANPVAARFREPKVAIGAGRDVINACASRDARAEPSGRDAGQRCTGGQGRTRCCGASTAAEAGPVPRPGTGHCASGPRRTEARDGCDRKGNAIGAATGAINGKRRERGGNLSVLTHSHRAGRSGA